MLQSIPMHSSLTSSLCRHNYFPCLTSLWLLLSLTVFILWQIVCSTAFVPPLCLNMNTTILASTLHIFTVLLTDTMKKWVQSYVSLHCSAYISTPSLEKSATLFFRYNFVICWPIFKTLSPINIAVNFYKSNIKIAHHTSLYTTLWNINVRKTSLT